MRRLMLVFSVSATLAVAAVGIAGAQSEGTDVPNTPANTAQTSCDGSTIELNALETRILELHNQTRTDNGLPSLCVNPNLTEAARFHSQDMLDKGYLSHTSPDGETFPARFERFGYSLEGWSYSEVGENVGVGSGSEGEPEAMFEAWMNSPEHRDNILREEFREIGMGASTGTYKGYSDTTVYTVDFGVRS